MSVELKPSHNQRLWC